MIPLPIHRPHQQGKAQPRHLALLVVRRRGGSGLPEPSQVLDAWQNGKMLNRREIEALLSQKGWRIGPVPSDANTATD